MPTTEEGILTGPAKAATPVADHSEQSTCRLRHPNMRPSSCIQGYLLSRPLPTEIFEARYLLPPCADDVSQVP